MIPCVAAAADNYLGSYVELVEGDEGGSPISPAQPSRLSAPTPAPAAAEHRGGPTATALYDYEAAGESDP